MCWYFILSDVAGNAGGEYVQTLFALMQDFVSNLIWREDGIDSSKGCRKADDISSCLSAVAEIEREK